MQPCAVCGGVGVDAAGYCLHCRTFRGVPVQPVAPPPAYPGYPQPTSVPPAYPQQTSGGGYPGYSPAQYPPAQPARSRSFMIPLVALSATLVVLVTAIVVVLAMRGGGDEPGPGPIGAPTSGVPTAAATKTGDDECVVGTWRVTSHKEDVPVTGVGKVTFIGGSGGTLRLNADGTGETDYGSGTEFEGEMEGQTVRLEVSGRLTYSYTARDGFVSIRDLESTVTARLYRDGEQYGDTLPLAGSEDSATYTCSTDRLTQKTFLYTTEYERVS
jgi:hypothetical protein